MGLRKDVAVLASWIDGGGDAFISVWRGTSGTAVAVTVEPEDSADKQQRVAAALVGVACQLGVRILQKILLEVCGSGSAAIERMVALADEMELDKSEKEALRVVQDEGVGHA